MTTISAPAWYILFNCGAFRMPPPTSKISFLSISLDRIIISSETGFAAPLPASKYTYSYFKIFALKI